MNKKQLIDEVLSAAQSEEIEFYKRAKEGIDYFEDGEGLWHDIKEKDRKFKKILRDAEEEAHNLLAKKFNFRNDLPAFRHSLGCETKRILKDKYGVDWRALEEMNPYYVWFG